MSGTRAAGAADVVAEIPGVALGAPLGARTTYRVGGLAAGLVRVVDPAQLVAVATARQRHDLAVLAIGRGSNMLVSDDGFAGLVVSVADITDAFEVPAVRPGEPVVVRLGAGWSLPVVARQLVRHGVAGFEWAVGVPGSVGGAIKTNAGGHGSDMAASLVEAEIVDLAGEPEPRWIPAAELDLQFRRSNLRPDQIVLSVRLALHGGDRAASEAELAEVVAWRRAHQPGGQNAGSVFVNPVPGQVSAGELIDRLGLRGLRIGSAFVSDKHANFIQATEGGTAADVRAVMEAVRARVAAETGYRLRSEIRLIGFDDDGERDGADGADGALADPAPATAAPDPVPDQTP